jgi:hypothetical protein
MRKRQKLMIILAAFVILVKQMQGLPLVHIGPAMAA